MRNDLRPLWPWAALVILNLSVTATAVAQCFGEVEWQESVMVDRLRCGRPGFLSKETYYFREERTDTTTKSVVGRGTASHVSEQIITYTGGVTNSCLTELGSCNLIGSNYSSIVIPFDAAADLLASAGGACDRVFPLSGGCDCDEASNTPAGSGCGFAQGCGNLCLAAFNQLLMICCEENLYYPPTLASRVVNESLLTDASSVQDVTTTYVDGIGSKRQREEVALLQPYPLRNFTSYVLSEAEESDWWNGRFFLNSLVPDGELQCLGASLLRYRIKFKSRLGVKYTAKWNLLLTHESPERSTNIITGLSWSCIGDGQIIYSDYFQLPHPKLYEITDGEVINLEIQFDGNCATGPCDQGWDSPGDGPDLLDSAHFLISLGAGSVDGSAGVLSFHHDAPSPELATPAALRFNLETNLVAITTNLDGSIHVAAPLVLARIEVVNRHSYWVHCSAPNPDGSYQTNTPFLSHLIRNPHGDAGFHTLQHIRTRPGRAETNEFVCESTGPGTQAWRLISGNGLKGERLVKSIFANETRLESYRIFTPATQEELFRRDELFRTTRSGDQLLSRVIDPAGLALLTTNSYDTHGRLTLTQHPDGSWERREHDDDGWLQRRVRPFANQPLTAPNSDCRVTEYSYESVPDSPDDPFVHRGQPRTTWEIVRGQVLGKSMHAYAGLYQTHTRTAASPDAGWNDPANEASQIQFDGDHQVTFAENTDRTSQRVKRFNQDSGRLTITRFSDADGREFRMVEEMIDRLGRPVYRKVYDQITGVMIEQETHSDPDEFLRPTKIAYLDGTSITSVQPDCCNVARVTDRDGVVTTHTQDALGRRITTSRLGVITSNVLDAASQLRAQFRHGTSGRPILQRALAYDAAGRIVRETNALGGVTRYTYATDTLGQSLTTTVLPDGGVRTESRTRDGQLASLTGTAVFPVRYIHGVTNDSGQPRACVTEIKLDPQGHDTSEWELHLMDSAGRRCKTVYPGAPAPNRQSYFNAKGQLWKERDPDGVITLHEYNARGERELTCLDADRNGQIDRDGRDRITQTVSDLVAAHDTFVHRTRTYVWATDRNPAPTLLSTVETSVDGLKTWRNQSGAITLSARTIPRNDVSTVTETEPHGALKLSLYRTGRLVATARFDSNGVQVARTTFNYDNHGRVFTITDARAGATTYLYNNADQIVRVVTPNPGGVGNKPQVTTTQFDSMGRATSSVLPDGSRVECVFSTRGEPLRTSGSRTYPTGYNYDAQGRLTHITNWSGFAQAAGARVTRWIYEPSRGWLDRKLDADDRGPRYEYTPAGRLKRRHWARGIDTSYAYNALGDLEQVYYDDGATPGITYTHDRRGQRTAVSRGGDSWRLFYNAAGQLVSEAGATGTQAGLRVTNTIDGWSRRTSVATYQAGSALALTLHHYSYDPAGRLAAVGSGQLLARYSYLPDSPLVGQIAFQQNGATRMNATRQYDLLNRLSTITSQPAGSATDGPTLVPVSHENTHNDANQRTRTTLADGSFWDYAYDALGQVISGQRFWSDGTPVAGQQFEYGFDDIGNRTIARTGGNQDGGELRATAYAANSLNQITRRDVSPFIDICGVATATANDLRVNDTPAYRRGEYFRAELKLENSTGPVWQPIAARAVLNGQSSSQTGHVFLSPSAEDYSFDADGNLTQDGRWSYDWDAENRLIAMRAREDLPASARLSLHYGYDPQGRRISKTVSNWTGTAWNRVLDERYLYDGRNLLAVLNADRILTKSFVWGSDLSGRLQGAGGVGGLLAITTGNSNAFAATDGNGNVTALFDATSGAITAQYEYGPFGELIRRSGPAAAANPFRFSTKYQDDETDLSYYGYRYYSSLTGRWISRDPIGESGGVPLYALAANNPIKNFDIDGRIVHYAWTTVDWAYYFRPTFWWDSWFRVGSTRNAAQVDTKACCRLDYRGFTDYSTPEYLDKYRGTLDEIKQSFATAASAAISSGACFCMGKRVDGLEMTAYHTYRSSGTVTIQLSGGIDVGIGRENVGNITGKLGVTVTIPPAVEQSTIVTKYLICPTGHAEHAPTVRLLSMTPLLQRTHAVSGYSGPALVNLANWVPPPPPDN